MSLELGLVLCNLLLFSQSLRLSHIFFLHGLLLTQCLQMKSFRSHLARRPGAAALLTLDGSVIALLLAFFSRSTCFSRLSSRSWKLEGFALMADMVYVTQVRVGCAALILP